jgi:hypothetical protein
MRIIFFSCLFFCIVLLSACIKNSDYVLNQGLKSEDIIKISLINPGTLLADSTTQTNIRVYINPSADSTQNVTLTSSGGLINGKSTSETMSVNLKRYADFILKPGQNAGFVTLRATVLNNYFIDTVLSFGVAYPDTVIVKPNAFSVLKGVLLPVSINLVRYSGFPSKNQTVLLSAIDSIGNPIGQFNYAGAYNPGNLLNGSFVAPLTFTGQVTLQASVFRKDGSKVISKPVIINVL